MIPLHRAPEPRQEDRRAERRILARLDTLVALAALAFGLGCLELLGRLTHIHVLAAMVLGATSLLVSVVVDLLGGAR